MVTQFLLFLLVSTLLCSSYAAPEEDLIKSLPGLRKQPMFRQYSGYLEALGNRHLHYWFMESTGNAATDPVVLWLNGGPGCSSMLAVLTEHGPFTIQTDGSLEYNPYSWNQVANIIYLESPAGVGYSYSDDEDYATDDDQVSANNLAAIKSFFKKFPEYKNNKFFLTGESYGGIYVPTLSERLLEEPSIKFEGFAVGNGMSDFNMNENSIIHFAYYHGLFGPDLYEKLQKYCCGSVHTECSFTKNMSHLCVDVVRAAVDHIYGIGLNMYNLYAECETTKFAPGLVSYYDLTYHFPSIKHIQKQKLFVKAMPQKNLRLTPPCINGTASTVYLNDKNVREALHIPKQIQEWQMCSSVVSVSYKMLYESMRLQYLKAIAAKKRIMVYNGDVDMACNFLGDEWFLKSLKLNVTKPRSPWHYKAEDGTTQVAGFVIEYSNVTFVTVRGAGHMVPTDAPIQALKAFKNFIQNGNL